VDGWPCPSPCAQLVRPRAKKLDPRLGHPVVDGVRQARAARCGTASIQGNRIEQCVPMAKFDSPYDRVRKLPKQFKPLRAYEEERRRGVAHTPEYDEQMRVLKEEFQRWLLAE
jgi:hypothetical protein